MKDDITNYLELRLQEARLVGDEVSDEFIIPYLEELLNMHQKEQEYGLGYYGVESEETKFFNALAQKVESEEVPPVELCGECGQPTVSVKGWSDKY